MHTYAFCAQETLILFHVEKLETNNFNEVINMRVLFCYEY